MLYFIADFGQLGHPPGESSRFAGLSTLREPFGKNHTSSGSCFLYSKPVENRSKKKGSQQALFWGKQERPTPRRFSRREVMPKKRTFHWRKAITPGQVTCFFLNYPRREHWSVGLFFFEQRSPVKRPCHHCLVKIPSAKSKRLLSEDFPAPESLKLLNVIRWGHTASAARPTSSNAVQLQGQPAAKPSAPSSVILKALSACLKISRKPSARSQARVPRLTASS